MLSGAKENDKIMYVGGMSFYDGMTDGALYTVKKITDRGYIIEPNDLGAESNMSYSKFAVGRMEILKYIVKKTENYLQGLDFVLANKYCVDKSEWKRLYIQLGEA